MLYKEYGKTGKQISAIGFGGMRFVKSKNGYDLDKCAEVIKKANELGVNYFDTAPYYCDDNSEAIMGHAFKNMPGQFYVSTKSSQKSGDELRKQLESSLKRLGLSKINFFHIWCILNLEDYKSRIVKGGAYEAALKAKNEGLIEHIVFSTHCNGEEIETIVNDGYFEGMTVGYNILNFPFRQKGIRVAYERGLGVATMNPLGGGIIPQKADYFSFLKSAEDRTVVEAALRFNGSHKEITTVLAGMGSVSEVLENVKIGDNMREFDEVKLAQIKDKLSNSMDKLCTGCRYCEHCPQNIPVSKYMLAYNDNILGKPQDTLNTLKWHWGIPQEGVKDCIQCGLCEEKCTQHLPIMDRLNQIEQW